MMDGAWQKIADCWQIKAVVSGAISCLTFLLGDVTATPFVALWSLVIIDTITRWMALGNKALKEHGRTDASVWCGIWLAVMDRTINSNMMRTRFQSKVLAYLILLIGFNLLGQILPDKILGKDIDDIPNTFISTWLAFVELQSIVENLIDMGVSGLTPLASYLCRKKDCLTGTVSQTISQTVSQTMSQVGDKTSSHTETQTDVQTTKGGPKP